MGSSFPYNIVFSEIHLQDQDLEVPGDFRVPVNVSRFTDNYVARAHRHFVAVYLERRFVECIEYLRLETMMVLPNDVPFLEFHLLDERTGNANA